MTNKPDGATRASFLRSQKAMELRSELENMVKSPIYNTRVISLLNDESSYFIEKHMKYMSIHLNMDHLQYIRNLKLMTKVG